MADGCRRPAITVSSRLCVHALAVAGNPLGPYPTMPSPTAFCSLTFFCTLVTVWILETTPLITTRYYTGRLAAYDEDFQKADEHLSYAFEHCLSAAPNNLRRVLRYLIPVSSRLSGCRRVLLCFLRLPCRMQLLNWANVAEQRTTRGDAHSGTGNSYCAVTTASPPCPPSHRSRCCWACCRVRSCCSGTA